MTRLLVIGNCQARPLSAVIERSGLAKCLPPIILHLARPEDEAEHNALIAQADVVLAQKTDDSFALAHLRSQRIRAAHPCARVWPNIFYAAQQPFLRYFTHATAGRLFGPMEAMHDLRIYLSWRAAHGLSGPSSLPQGYEAQVAAHSLDALRGREAGCDVIISDYLAGADDTQPLFFTFNHPTNQILTEMAQRLAGTLPGWGTIRIDQNAPEALGRYIVPSTWSDAAQTYRGDMITPEGARDPAAGPQTYDIDALTKAYFQVYDANDAFRDVKNIRLTPHMHGEADLLTI